MGNDLDQLWEYLRVAQGVKAELMFEGLCRLRRFGPCWEGVPNTIESFKAGLAELLRQGRAEEYEGMWLVLHKSPEPEWKKPEQRSLFA